jgi:hypothetical protein
MKIKTKRNHKKPIDDDGRVIANMNIEGTPWYIDKSRELESPLSNEPELSRKETFYLMKSALTAGLIIGMVFITIFFAFIFFCTRIWLK